MKTKAKAPRAEAPLEKQRPQATPPRRQEPGARDARAGCVGMAIIVLDHTGSYENSETVKGIVRVLQANVPAFEAQDCEAFLNSLVDRLQSAQTELDEVYNA